MPVLDHLVTAMIGDTVRYERRGLSCDACLPVSPCMGHWTVDGEELNYDEWRARYAIVEQRLVTAFSTTDWDRVMLGAWGYANLLRDNPDELEAVDIMLSLTEPRTLTDREKHIEDMRATLPRLFESQQ